MKTLWAAFVLVLVSMSPGWAHEFSKDHLFIDHPWARPSLGGSPNGAAYMTITNNGEAADRLVNVDGDVAQTVELHATLMDGDVMRMRPIHEGIEILPGETLEIVPGGVHVMMMGLLAPLKDGDRFPLSLTFERAGSVDVTVNVESRPGKTDTPSRERHH